MSTSMATTLGDVAQLVVKIVNHGDPCEVRGLRFELGERRSRHGPPWYTCLVRGPGGIQTVKESTAYDSFIGWLAQQTPQSLREQFPGADIPTVDELRGTLQALALQQATQLYSSEKYGSALAAGVTARLSTGAQMANSHRDYCGIGLAINGSIFVMAEVQDGYLETTLRTWTTADEFKAWLAVQSDFAQSGFDPATGLVDAWLQGNQRITRQRLNDFVAAGGNEGTGRKDQAQGAKQKRKKGRI